MNDHNLIPNSQRSPTEVRENGRKGGIASGKVRRERKTIAEIINKVLDEELPGTELTKREAIVVKTLERAYKQGRVEDLERIAKLTGEYQQNINVKSDGVVCVVRNDDEAKKIADIKGIVDKMKED